MNPTSRSAIVLGLAALGALVFPLALVLALAVALVTATVIDALWVRHAPSVDRELPVTLARGRPVRLTIETEARPGTRIDVRQAVPPDLELSESLGRARLDTSLVARRRGRHVMPAVAARSTGPLGLGSWYHRPSDDTEVRVLPDMPAAHRLVETLRRSRYGDAGRRLRGPLGLGTDFESIRDYSPDDDIRQVNWRATSRVGKPMSNQYRVEQDRDIICVVDSGRLMGAPFGDRTRLDAAVDAVAAVAAVTNEMDDRCGVVMFDSKILRRVTPARRNARAVIEAIHDVEPSSLDSDYELAFRIIGGGKRSLVLVFTDLIEEAAARPLLDAVPVLTRRHAVIVVTARDDELTELVSSPPAAPLDAYRSAVALNVLEARARVALKLRSSGASVIEASPDTLGAACVRAYLKAKTTARL